MAFDKETIKRVIIALTDKKAGEDLTGTAFTEQTLEFIGKGHGASKTTTSIYGNTITEDFDVGDEVFMQWQVPQLADFTDKFKLHFDFAPVTAEVGKTFSLEINITASNGGSIGNLGSQFIISDISVPETALESFSVEYELPKYFVKSIHHDLHIRIKRISSSNDLIGDIALHHSSMDYYRHQR
jgi:hypothetical protein